jgi:hypothetical protein
MQASAGVDSAKSAPFCSALLADLLLLLTAFAELANQITIRARLNMK